MLSWNLENLKGRVKEYEQLEISSWKKRNLGGGRIQRPCCRILPRPHLPLGWQLRAWCGCPFPLTGFQVWKLCSFQSFQLLNCGGLSLGEIKTWWNTVSKSRFLPGLADELHGGQIKLIVPWRSLCPWAAVIILMSLPLTKMSRWVIRTCHSLLRTQAAPALTTALASSWSLPGAPRATDLPPAQFLTPIPFVNLAFPGAVSSKVWFKFLHGQYTRWWTFFILIKNCVSVLMWIGKNHKWFHNYYGLG